MKINRYTERKMMMGEVIDTLTNSAEASSDTADSAIGGSNRQDYSTNRSNSFSESSSSQAIVGSVGTVGIPLVNFHIIVEEKLPVHARRRYEKQVLIQRF